MYAQLGPAYIDDRDCYGNKRLELAGRGHAAAAASAAAAAAAAAAAETVLHLRKLSLIVQVD
jgi:hypothetical protein